MSDTALRPTLIPPDHPLLSAFTSGAPTTRAARARLKRAEKAGVLPRRVYLSAQRFAYRRDELEAALENLPRHYAAALGKAG